MASNSSSFRLVDINPVIKQLLAKDNKDIKVSYCTVHATEADSNTLQLVVHLQPAPRLRKLEIDLNMADFAVKARNAQGNIIAETSVKRVARRR